MAFDTTGQLRFIAFFPPPAPSALARLAVLAANLTSVAGLAMHQPGYYGSYSLAPRDPLPPSPEDYAHVVAAHADSAGLGPPWLLNVRKGAGKVERRLAL